MKHPVSLDSRAIVLSEIEAMGGAERSALALSRWLMNHDVPHHFVTYVDHINLAAHADHAIQVVQLRPAMRAISKISALRRYFSPRPLVHGPLMSGFQPALHATLAGLRGFNCLMHDTPSLFSNARSLSTKQRLIRWSSDKIASRGLRSGGHTIVTSEYLRAECKAVFKVDADLARMGGMSHPDAFRLRPVKNHLQMLSVSRIESNKRVDWILRALASMETEAEQLSRRVDWSLDIAGRGSKIEEMRELAANLGLGDRVRFLGFVSDTDLERLYAKAHLFLMPAVQGYGIPAIEALARGVPVLLHRESGVSDILLHTPWATVTEAAEEGMLPGLAKAISAVLTGAHLGVPPPPLPSEENWAQRVAALCGWI